MKRARIPSQDGASVVGVLTPTPVAGLSIPHVNGADNDDDPIDFLRS